MLRMKKSCLLAIGALLLVSTGSAIHSEAAVNVNVGVSLPAIRYSGPPSVVVIPGTYVYMVPDMDVDVMFYHGYWWRPYQGHWYRSRDYKGRWSYMEPRRVPAGLRGLPQDYRHRLSPGYARIPHKDVQKNWKKWEKEKHWDKRSEQVRSGQDGQGHGGEGGQGRGGQGHGGEGGQGQGGGQGHGGQGGQGHGGGGGQGHGGR